MIPTACIEAIEADNIVLFDEPIGALWPRWGSRWIREVGVCAVVDHQRTLVGEIRCYDMLDYLLKMEAEVYHLWPYTHVIKRTWSDRVNLLDQVPVSVLMRGRGVTVHNPPADWSPGIKLFAQHMTPVIWITDHAGKLSGKVTLRSAIPE